MNEELLAAAVVKQAVLDWRTAIAPSNPRVPGYLDSVRRKSERLKELRRFFRGKRADVFSGGNAGTILAELEEEYTSSKARLQIEAYERGEIG